MDFDLYDLEAMGETFDNLEVNAEAAISSVLEEYGPQVAQRAQSLAPVRTGALQDSITYEIDGETLLVYGGVPYYPYVEFGTARFDGRYMCAQAYQEYEQEILDAVDLAIQASVSGEPYSAFGRKQEPYI